MKIVDKISFSKLSDPLRSKEQLRGMGPGYDRSLVSLQATDGFAWKSLIGPEAVFSTTGPQVDASGNLCAHNYIPNSEGVGGAPGVLPTGWTKTSDNGITVAVVGAGGGYTDIRVYGKAQTTFSTGNLKIFSSTFGSAGLAVNFSANIEVLSGSLVMRAFIHEYNSEWIYLRNTSSPLSANTEIGIVLEDNTNKVEVILSSVLTAGTTVDFTIRISRPQLSKSAVKLPYVPTYGSAAFGPSITDKGLWAGGAWTQMLQNSKFEGAVSGTPGTAPTNWTLVTTGGSTTIADLHLTLSTVANRHFLTQTVSVLANTKYYYRVVLATDGVATVENLFTVTGIPTGVSFTWEVNGITTAGSTILAAGTYTVAVVLTVVATAGTAVFRLGAGTVGSVTTTATFSNPQVSANYQYPYAASGPGQTITVPTAGASTGGNGTNTPLSDKMLECLRGKVDGVEKVLPSDAAWTKTGLWAVSSGVLSIATSTGSEVAYQSVVTIGERVLVRYRVNSVSGSGIRITSGGVLGANRTTPGTYTDEIIPASANLGFATIAAGTSATIDNISIQRLLPSVFTACAAVYVGAGSGELASGDHGVLTFNNSSGLGIKMVGAGSLQIIRGSDGTVGINNGVTAWNRDEIHLKVVQTNAAGTQFRVGNRRYTSAMVPIDALTWGSWAAYDGSFGPLTHLRLALNGTIPLWFRLVSLASKSLSDIDILKQVRYVR